MELLGNLKTYEWGKLGMESEVAKLAKSADESFSPSSSTPYSELWMGDHSSGPSTVKATGTELGGVISQDVVANIGGKEKLTFLFKVLSIRKALSIQVHPSKKEAERLHTERPDVYKDANHKPEIAIALTEFVALCGFRPHKEIHRLVSEHPELVDLIGKDLLDEMLETGSSGLKKCYTKVMRSSVEAIGGCIEKLEAKFTASAEQSQLAEIFLQLNKDFPNDVGTLSLFFFNILKLAPGEAIFLEAKLPHAYLSGDCIECMACSDNVVRAGLTPKYKDVDTLLEMLIYEGKPPADMIFKPESLVGDQKFTELFLPPVEDFAVAKVVVPRGESTYQITNSAFGSIALTLSGSAELSGANMESVQLGRGSIVFLPATAGPKLQLKISDSDEEFVLYQAFYNDF